MATGTESRWADSVMEVESLKINGTAVTATAAELNALDGITATVGELNRAADLTGRVVNTTGPTLSLVVGTHEGLIVTVDDADGTAITLPAASGTGALYTVIIGTAISSNSTTIKAASASDSFVGRAYGVDTDVEGATGYTWNANSGDDTVTMNGTATGGQPGDKWMFRDMASGVWEVEGHITQSGGSEATPFSATVS